MFSDSEIAKSLKCGATKTSQISKAIGSVYYKKVLHQVSTQPFTLMIDESNDASDKVNCFLFLLNVIILFWYPTYY